MKTLVFNIIGTLALGISLLFSTKTDAATVPNRFVTNSDITAVWTIAMDTNAINFAVSNNVNTSGLGDLNGMFVSLEQSGVWPNFIDGILFQPRFGTNSSLMGRQVVGYRGNYTADNWGINLTNVLSLQLPGSLSNVTIVAMVKDLPMWQQLSGAGAVIWGLSNTNTKSGIVSGVSDAVGDSRWTIQETYHLVQWPGANNGSFSNLFQPLRMFSYDWNGMGTMQGQPHIVAWQRDVNGDWRMYLNTVQGKISLNNAAFVYHSPTNATDPLSFFTLGYDGITNEPNIAIKTNINVAAVFIFSTTNFSAVLAGYQAAMWSLDTDTAEFWYGDSRLCDVGPGVFNVAQFYQRRLNSAVFFTSKAQGGARADTFVSSGFLANGGFGEVTNVPRSKIKNLKVTYSLGVNDGYQAGETGAIIFQKYTNAIYPWAAAGARVRFCDTYQVATNASALTYSMATETNIFVASQMVRTNIAVPISEYVPLRDSLPQWMIQTNGLFSADGVHLNGRTNSLAQQMIADLIACPEERSITNGPIGPP